MHNEMMMERKYGNYWKLISFAIVEINACTYNQHLICPLKKKLIRKQTPFVISKMDSLK